jgi:hypothetical protein
MGRKIRIRNTDLAGWVGVETNGGGTMKHTRKKMEMLGLKKGKDKGKWVEIGQVAVDSGQLMICDPCYIDSVWKESPFVDIRPEHAGEFSYNGCCHGTLTGIGHVQMLFQAGHPGAGVAFRSGLGDGIYPAEALIVDYGTKRAPDLRIKEVRIRMIQ